MALFVYVLLFIGFPQNIVIVEVVEDFLLGALGFCCEKA